MFQCVLPSVDKRGQYAVCRVGKTRTRWIRFSEIENRGSRSPFVGEQLGQWIRRNAPVEPREEHNASLLQVVQQNNCAQSHSAIPTENKEQVASGSSGLSRENRLFLGSI